MKIFSVFCFLILPGLFYPAKAGLNPTVSDTVVERLMNNYQFRDAADVLNNKLKSTKSGDFDRLLYYNNQLGIAYMRLQLFDSMMVCGRNSLHFLTLSADSALISDGWKVASYAYNRNGDLDSAIFYTKLMLGYGERHGDKKLIRNSMNSLGTIMNQSNKSAEALEYFKKACLLNEEINDSTYYSIMFFNLGLTYANLNKLDSSLYYLEKSLKRSLKEKNYGQALYAYVMLSDTYMELNDFNKWKETTLSLYNLAEKMNYQDFIAQAYNRMLYGFTKNKNYTEAISYGNKALEILKEYPFPSLQISVDSGMYVAYEAKGDYVNAIKYLKTFYHEKYSMLSEKQREHLNEMQVMFEVKEKDLTIAEQKLALDKKQKRLQLLLFLSALLVLIVAGIIIYNIRNHQFRKKLYKKEKYLDYRVNEVRQWVKGDIIKRSITPLNPEIYAAEENPDNINIDILSPQNILYAELREMIENKKLYLNPELNLQKVIKLLGTNKKYLYEAISSNSDDNFRNFINRYRVDYAKRMIEENVRKKEETNISDLFSFCGFNNATSFFRTFKTITGLTPKEYAAEAKIDYKSEMIT